MAAFANLTLDKVASGDTLVASSTVGSVTTKPIAVVAAAATQLVVTSQPPPSLVAGDPFGVTVTAEDRFGNTDLTYDGTVTLGLAERPRRRHAGRHTHGAAAAAWRRWPGLTLDKAGGGYTLQVSSGLGVATTNPVTVSRGGRDAVGGDDRPTAERRCREHVRSGRHGRGPTSATWTTAYAAPVSLSLRVQLRWTTHWAVR